MALRPGRWTVRLADRAERDLSDIVRWTKQSFGNQQASKYRTLIFQRIRALKDGPVACGGKMRRELGSTVFTVAVARRGIKASHQLICATANADQIMILRILHDSMDPTLHLPSRDP